jgi:hypothetical protein
MFKQLQFFKTLVPKSDLVASDTGSSGTPDASGTVQAHAQTRQLTETIYYPDHVQRPSQESAEFEQNKKEMIASGDACWICGGTAESTGQPLEGHHYNFEWALANSIDINKVKKNFPDATDVPTFLDSKENLMILCAKHHRSNKYGIHMVTMPAWIAPRNQLDGWDLVSGPNAAAELEDQTLWYPEH